jgi:hypothetical protein
VEAAASRDAALASHSGTLTGVRSGPRPVQGGGRIGVVKLLRARGGCLGVISDSGVEGCEKSGGAAERASNPEFPSRPRELKHLSTWRKGNQPRLPQ